jgi:hypothetical protein
LTPSPPDPRAELVQRVARSAAFHKTWRLRELLLFLCDRALREPASPPREQEIAEAVFGRGPDFDPIVDGLVRVQVTQLRKRLHQHFSAEGADEPTILEIPRGSYVVAFRPRNVAIDGQPAAFDAEETGEKARPGEPGRRAVVTLGVGAGVLLLLCLGLLVQNHRLRSASGLPGAPRPGVERLWRDLFQNERPTRLVLADGSLTVFLDVTQRDITATAYQRGESAATYRPGVDTRPDPRPDPPSVELARQLLPQPYTSMVDADLAHRAGALLAAAGATSEVLRARAASPDTFRGANAVICGPRRSNPWAELFEEQVNFQSRHDRFANTGSFVNRKPQPGEAERYTAVREREGYCRVAHVASLDGTGSILLLTGTDLPSTQAGLELVTREEEVAGLRQRLGLGAAAPFPRFEVLLRVHFAAGAMSRFETVAHRTLDSR